MKKFLFVIGALALVVYMADNGSHNSGTSTSTPVTQSTTEMSVLRAMELRNPR
jgi:hypothetical protein